MGEDSNGISLCPTISYGVSVSSYRNGLMNNNGLYRLVKAGILSEMVLP